MSTRWGVAYSPDPQRPGHPLIPFEISSGKLIDEIWQLWLAYDPVRLAPEHGDELKSMRRIYLDAGRADEWYLDLGAQAFANELDKLGVEYSLELFDGKHGGHRVPVSRRDPRARHGALA